MRNLCGGIYLDIQSQRFQQITIKNCPFQWPWEDDMVNLCRELHTHHLYLYFQRFVFKFQPTRNQNYPWQSCFVLDHNKMRTLCQLYQYFSYIVAWTATSKTWLIQRQKFITCSFHLFNIFSHCWLSTFYQSHNNKSVSFKSGLVKQLYCTTPIIIVYPPSRFFKSYNSLKPCENHKGKKDLYFVIYILMSVLTSFRHYYLPLYLTHNIIKSTMR